MNGPIATAVDPQVLAKIWQIPPKDRLKWPKVVNQSIVGVDFGAHPQK